MGNQQPTARVEVVTYREPYPPEPVLEVYDTTVQGDTIETTVTVAAPEPAPYIETINIVPEPEMPPYVQPYLEPYVEPEVVYDPEPGMVEEYSYGGGPPEVEITSYPNYGPPEVEVGGYPYEPQSGYVEYEEDYSPDTECYTSDDVEPYM